MTDDIERVARAIWRVNYPNIPSGMFAVDDETRSRHMAYATAATAAHKAALADAGLVIVPRVATDEMITAVQSKGLHSQWEEDVIRANWQAMVAAALGE